MPGGINTKLFFHYVVLDVYSHSDKVHSWLDAHYDSYDQRSLLSQQIYWTVFIEEIGSSHEMPFAIPAEAHALGRFMAGAHTFIFNDLLFAENFSDCPYTLEMDLKQRSIKMNIGGDLLRFAESFIYALIRQTLKQLILPLSGILMLHGAVLSKHGKTLFLCGEGGAGKTTTSLLLLQRGFVILSDDSPLFTIRSGQAMALSSLDEFSVEGDVMELLSPLKPYLTGQREISRKFRISRSCMGSQDCLEAYGPLAVTHLIQLQRDELAEAQLIPVAKDEVIRSLLSESKTFFSLSELPQGAEVFHEISAFGFELVSELVMAAKVFQLRYSSDHFSSLPDLVDSALIGE